MFGLALPALRLALGRLRGLIGTPVGGALAATGAALVVVGGLALGLVWLRGDARRDAEVVCRERQIAADLARERQRSAEIERALGAAATELRLRRDQQQQAEIAMRQQAGEAERLRNDVEKLEAAAGADRAVCLPDDDWLRRKRDAARAGAGSR